MSSSQNTLISHTDKVPFPIKSNIHKFWGWGHGHLGGRAFFSLRHTIALSVTRYSLFVLSPFSALTPLVSFSCLVYYDLGFLIQCWVAAMMAGICSYFNSNASNISPLYLCLLWGFARYQGVKILYYWLMMSFQLCKPVGFYKVFYSLWIVADSFR